MSALAEFFIRNIIVVYFFYGLSFFCMGFAIFLEVGRSSELDFARALRPLAWFGLIHGSHEWYEMLLLIYPLPPDDPAWCWITPLRLGLLAISFLFLVAFGSQLIIGSEPLRYRILMMLIVIVIWVSGLFWLGNFQCFGEDPQVAISADVYTRYALAIPGAVLTAWGLLLQRRKFFQSGMYSFGNDVAIAAIAFFVYGGIGQIFASPSTIFPSSYLNDDIFLRWFGFPIQVLRAAMAGVAAIFIIRSLRAFEEETQSRIENLRQAQLDERQQLEEVRAKLLHRTVKAQEAERQRIARELHDETGQTLTALGLGLRALSETAISDPERARLHARQLEKLASMGLEDLQGIVAGLHPPQLDDLGLLAALRWYTSQVSQLYSMKVNLTSVNVSEPCKLPQDVRIAFYRIAQEAITNAIRHAFPDEINVRLICTDQDICLQVEDDGVGFNVDALNKDIRYPHWGLLGMKERSALIGGICNITSQPGGGTLVELRVPQDLFEQGEVGENGQN